MFTQMFTMLHVYLNSLKREEGQDLAEYGLLLVLIAIVVIGAVTMLADDLTSIFESLANSL